ncbi:hypothetical protein [Bacteroides neonati]|uniref:hypothetical protein n=1 Tax=Bacteroides neonati TaxID=1347393 RepID=UPI0004B317E0|nr:hypothetical protein [Bacteroides neonati]
MKTLRWIQNVAAVVAMFMALYLADGIEVSRKDALSASVMVLLAVLMLLSRAWDEERRAE